MTRWFNIAGPCFANEHYMIPVPRRAGAMYPLIEQGRWFSLVSGRQTGKTTVVQTLADELTARGDRLVLWVDLQTTRGLDAPGEAFREVTLLLERALRQDAPGVALPSEAEVARWLAAPSSALLEYLHAVCEASARPVVLLLDEADVLGGAAVVSFLTQLRALYLARHKRKAPWCVVLIGVRAVRDYVVEDARRTVPWLGTASPFNVTVENVGLAAFTEAEVAELAAQHTAETGQRFEPEALARVYDLSRGHPWLVNALCDQCTRRDVTDRAVAVTAAHVEAAKETLILERRTHIDSLLGRLREERVRRVIAPMIAGETVAASQLDDDIAYVIGLGLCRVVDGRCAPANPIYREVILRTLTWGTQVSLYQQTAWYVRPDGSLDVPKLLAAWQTFWRKDGHLGAQGIGYRESGPHLMLMAFLQRVVNGGGRIEREYALGKGALDLMIAWRDERHAIEVKLRRDTETEDEALEQVAGYLDTLGVREGWLVMFDLRSTAPWSERLYTRTIERGARRVHLVGC